MLTRPLLCAGSTCFSAGVRARALASDSERLALQEAMEACLIHAHQKLQAEARRRQAIQRDLRFLRDSDALKQWEASRASAASTARSLQADLAKLEARLQKLRAQARRAAAHAVQPEPEAEGGAHRRDCRTVSGRCGSFPDACGGGT